MSLALSQIDLVVLCGGRGTRLGLLTQATPKPLLPVAGKPFLWFLLRSLRKEGFRRILLSIHYLPDQFREFIERYQQEIPEMEWVVEPEPLGTGGALQWASKRVRSSLFAAINGDSWFDQPFGPVLASHQQGGRSFTAVGVDPFRVEGGASGKGIWTLDSVGGLADLRSRETASQDWVNAGRYLLETDRVRAWPAGRYALEEKVGSLFKGWKTGLFCSSARLLDIGTPELYAQAGRLLKEGREGEVCLGVG